MDHNNITVDETGVIEDVGVLDLTALSEERLAGITQIRNVGLVLVPEDLAGQVERLVVSCGQTLPLPRGVKVKVLSGQAIVDGEALARPDAEDGAVTIINGQMVITSPVTEVGYQNLIVHGQVIAPRSGAAALNAAISRLSGQIIEYPYSEGTAVHTRTGQVKLSGDALANPGGGENDVLVVAGQAVVAGPVERVGYREMVIVGQALLPRESEGMLSRSLGSSIGQIGFYTDRNPRFFLGTDRFAAGFFELLEEPVTLVLIGDFTVEPDATPELLRDKVSEIALIGNLRAPRALVPMLQILTREKIGTITVVEEDEQEA